MDEINIRYQKQEQDFLRKESGLPPLGDDMALRLDTLAAEAQATDGQPGFPVVICLEFEELHVLEDGIYFTSNPALDSLGAKIKASMAGKPGQWREYLVYGGEDDDWDEEDEDEDEQEEAGSPD